MLNKVILIGRLTRDPEFKTIPGVGTPSTTFTLAVDRPFSNKQTGKPEADFINIVTYRRIAELCRDFTRQGNLVCVEGRLQIRNYQGNDGQKRYVTEVVADNVEFLTPKSQSNGNQYGQNQGGNYDGPFDMPSGNGGYNNGNYGMNKNNSSYMNQPQQQFERDEDDSYKDVSFTKEDLF